MSEMPVMLRYEAYSRSLQVGCGCNLQSIVSGVRLFAARLFYLALYGSFGGRRVKPDPRRRKIFHGLGLSRLQCPVRGFIGPVR